MPTQSKTLTPEAIQIFKTRYSVDMQDGNSQTKILIDNFINDTELLLAAGLHTTEELNQAVQAARTLPAETNTLPTNEQIDELVQEIAIYCAHEPDILVYREKLKLLSLSSIQQ